jgi:hypothetical protein
MANLPRVFLSYAFGKDNKNVVDVFREVATAEKFELVTGDPPAPQTPPELVRSRILGCNLFAALLTNHGNSKKTSAWVSNEIGMAYAIYLPLLICKEASVEDLGLAAMASSYLVFDRNDLQSFRESLRTFLRKAKVEQAQTPANLGGFIQTLTEEALAGRLKRELRPKEKDQLVNAFNTIVKEHGLNWSAPQK